MLKLEIYLHSISDRHTQVRSIHAFCSFKYFKWCLYVHTNTHTHYVIVNSVRRLTATRNQSLFWFLTSQSSSTWLKHFILDPNSKHVNCGRRCVRNLLLCSAYKKGPKPPSGPHSKPSIELHSSARQTARLAVLHPSSRWVDATTTTTSPQHRTTLLLRYGDVMMILWKWLLYVAVITQEMDFILKLP